MEVASVVEYIDEYLADDSFDAEARLRWANAELRKATSDQRLLGVADDIEAAVTAPPELRLRLLTRARIELRSA